MKASNIKAWALGAWAILLGLAAGAATAPSQFTYQGQLRNANGSPATPGVYSIEARIYDNSSGGSVLWGKSYPVHVDSNGFFNVVLGDGGGLTTPTPKYDDLTPVFNGPNRFLSITVVQTPSGWVMNKQEMSPRLQLLSNPYALHANQADIAQTWNGLAATNLAQVGDSTPAQWFFAAYDGAVFTTLNGYMAPYLPVFSNTVVIQNALTAGALNVPGGCHVLGTNGIALGGIQGGVSIMGAPQSRHWGNPIISETTDGFLMVPIDSYAYDNQRGTCYSGGQYSVKFYSPMNMEIILYSHSGTGWTDGQIQGSIIIPIPRGQQYTVESGQRPCKENLQSPYFLPLSKGAAR